MRLEMRPESIFTHGALPLMTFIAIQLPWHRLLYSQLAILVLTIATQCSVDPPGGNHRQILMATWVLFIFFAWFQEALHRAYFSNFQEHNVSGCEAEK
jgi:hypothetical protein